MKVKNTKEVTKMMKNIINSVKVRIDDGLGPLFEDLSGMMLRIRSERNQVDKAYEF
jgi:hypothetical protein